jgi:hypothetical protein
MLKMKSNLKLVHIKEPELTFAYGQKMEDPRDGITLFGPFSKDRLSGDIEIGIIGPEEQRKFALAYLGKIIGPVANHTREIARPYFPGLEAAFGVSINLRSIPQLDVPAESIEECLLYTDGHQRVHRLTNLFADRLRDYQREEEIPVKVWIIAIPEKVYKYGRPKSRVPKSSINITESLRKAERNSDSVFLFPELNELREAYDFEVNFHNQLKAKLLEYKVVTQIIRDTKIAYRELWDDPKRIDAESVFDSAKAWSIATALYYKSGGLPWKLGSVRKNVCYVGLVYKQNSLPDQRDNACCAAQMFLDSGDGMVFRGNVGPWYNAVTGEYHIDAKSAENLISKALEGFKKKSGSYPSELFVHSRTNFNDEEWSGFELAAKGKCKIVGVKIRDDNTFKLYRHDTYCVPRGTALVLNTHEGYLWTKGFVHRVKTQLGLETPNPLSIKILRGEADVLTVFADVMALTKLNYNSCIFADGIPVTLRFADSIGEILTAGRDITSDILPFKHYV